MRKLIVNNVLVTGLGNLQLVDSTNSFGPFLDSSTFQDGTVRTRKGKFVGRFTRHTKGGNTTVKVDV